MNAINRLHAQPEFYNTLLTNCTTAIFMHTRVNPGHLPFSWKVLASGYTPEYVYETGRFDTSLPFPELHAPFAGERCRAGRRPGAGLLAPHPRGAARDGRTRDGRTMKTRALLSDRAARRCSPGAARRSA